VSDNITERREWPRLALKLNVEFFAEQDEQEPHGAGTTENVSAGGIYFRTPEWGDLKIGQNLGLQLSGLSSINHGPLFRILHGRATILRVDLPPEEAPPYGTAGVAARFDERPRIGVYRFSA